MPRLDTSRIIELLGCLQNAQPSVFGADVHGFRSNPPLPQADIVEFERKHQVTLPPDYRQFLTCVGNGGAGPFYGIFPLGKIDDNFDLRAWQEEDGMVGVPSKPFPLEEGWNDLSTIPKEDIADRDKSEYDLEMDAFDRMYWNTSLVNGAIPICHEGCALRIWLVITGIQAGYLWEDKRSEHGGLMPLRLADGSSATFTGWYDEWMNACLAAR